MKNSRDKLVSRGAIIALIVLGLVQIVVQSFLLRDNTELFSQLSLPLIGLCLVLSVFIVAPFTFVLRRFYRKDGVELSFKQSLAQAYAGIGVSRFVPFAEIAMWRRLDRKRDVHVKTGSELGVAFYGIAFIVVTVLYQTSQVISLSIFDVVQSQTLIYSVFAVAATGSLSVTALLLAKRQGVLPPRLAKWTNKFLSTNTITPFKLLGDRNFGKKGWAEFLGAMSLSWLADITIFWIMLGQFGLDVPYILIMFLYTLTRGLSFIPVTPGGAGETEGWLGFLLTGYGYGEQLDSLISAIISFRLFSFWLQIAFGGLGYYLLNRKPHLLQ